MLRIPIVYSDESSPSLSSFISVIINLPFVKTLGKSISMASPILKSLSLSQYKLICLVYLLFTIITVALLLMQLTAYVHEVQ